MKFIDEVVIEVRAGDGGNGIASFRREPYVPKGGPDGGNGGNGGSIIFVSDSHLHSLEDITIQRLYQAENGQTGRSRKQSGKTGADEIIKIPVGTLVYDIETDELIHDFAEDSERLLIAQGGKGGKGNYNFATSTNRSPRKATAGKPGEIKKLRLELKLLADVGIIGKPNAGKSTLLSVLTNATPKVAGYPFSTLTPNLGVVITNEYKRFIMADIPGLTEGAAEGRGLGHQFLKHIERTRLVIILIESLEPDYGKAYRGLLKELSKYSDTLKELPHLLVLSKADLLDQREKKSRFKFDMKISAYDDATLEELVRKIYEKLLEVTDYTKVVSNEVKFDISEKKH